MHEFWCFQCLCPLERSCLVDWIIVTTRERSLDVCKNSVKVPSDLDDPKVIMAGFKHSLAKCVGCHRVPGTTDSDIGRGLNPFTPNFAQLESSYERGLAMNLVDKHIAFLVADGVEDLEYHVPCMRLEEEGAKIITAAMDLRPIRGKNGLAITPSARIESLHGNELFNEAAAAEI